MSPDRKVGRRQVLETLAIAGLGAVSGWGFNKLFPPGEQGSYSASGQNESQANKYKVVGGEPPSLEPRYKIVTREYHIVAQVDLSRAPQEISGLQQREFKIADAEDQKQLRTILNGFKFTGTEDVTKNSVLAERVLYLMPIFLQAEIETGIDWKIFMAIIGLENSFSVVTPNVDGIFQVTKAGGRDRDFQVGHECTPEEVLDQCRWMVSVIEEHARRANDKLNANIVPVKYGGASYLIAYNRKLTLDQIAKFAYAYNGIAYGPNYCGSGYVAVKVEHCGNPEGMNVSNGRGGYVYMQRVGFLGIIERLSQIDANVREIFSGQKQAEQKGEQKQKSAERPKTIEDLKKKYHFVDQRLLVPTAENLGSQPRDLARPTGVLWHYSVDPLKYPPEQRDGIRLVEYTYTAPDKRWGRPPYHFYIGLDGTIYWIYDVDRQAYHAGSKYNPTHLAVSYVDVEEMGRVPNAKQLEAMKDVTFVLMKMFGISACNVQGHYEVDSGKHDPAGVKMDEVRKELGCR